MTVYVAHSRTVGGTAQKSLTLSCFRIGVEFRHIFKQIVFFPFHTLVFSAANNPVLSSNNLSGHVLLLLEEYLIMCSFTDITKSSTLATTAFTVQFN